MARLRGIRPSGAENTGGIDVNIPYDKILHFMAGFSIATFIYGVTENSLYGLYAALFAGMMKEVRDWCCYKGFDPGDMLATWAGGVAGWALMEFVQYCVKGW